MAKTPKLKTKLPTNPRSRASRRRATSPSTNHAKSLDSTPLQAPLPHVEHSSVRHGGITKKRPSSRQKKQTRQQRLRQEKGLARAVDVLEKMERKVEGSLKKVRIGKERRRGWEEINGDGVKRKSLRVMGGGEDDSDQRAGMEVDDEWVDEDNVNDESVEFEREAKAGAVITAETTNANLDLQVDGQENEEDKIT